MKRVLGCLLLSLLCVTTVLAQLSTGTILGVVKDSTGAVVPAAEVSVRQTDTNQTRTLTTGGDGQYRFDQLQIGTYEITVKASGFSTAVQSGLVLSVGQESVSDFALEVGAVSQTVSVSAEASSLVDITTSSLSSLVTPETIADMPLNGRNYNDLTLLQMGITKVPAATINFVGFSGTQFSSNGAPQRSNTYLLDGAILTSVSGNNGASALGTTLGVDGIQEYRITTNNFDAEYGMTMGSQMTVASKSGSNTFHGDAFEFLRNSLLDARNHFDLPAYSKQLDFKRNPEFRRNQFGGAVGGPIQKDKTFFFGVYEGLRAYLGTTQTVTTLGTLANPSGCHNVTPGQILTSVQCPQLGVATATGGATPQMIQYLQFWPAPNLSGTNNGASNNYGWIFPQVTSENYGQIRIDHSFSNNDNLFGRYTIDQSELPFPGAFDGSESVEHSRNQFVTLAENHIFSSSVVNSARISLTREPLAFGNTIFEPAFTQNQYLIVQQPLGMGQLSPTGVSPIGAGTNPTPRNEFETLYTIGDDLNYNRGHHSFKFGFLVNHYNQRIETHGFDKGSVNFGNFDQFLQGIVSTFSAVLPQANNPIKYLHFETMGFYGQDSWKLFPRFTLNVGMRYEPTSSVSEIYGHASNLRNPLTSSTFTIGNPVFKNPSLRNWSPRFGFAWDVFGDGKTAVRGGFDLLYDLATLGTSYTLYAGYDPPFTQNFSTSSYSSIFGPLQIPAVLPAIGSFTPTFFGPAYNANQPHLMAYNLAVERRLPGQMSLTVAFAGSKGLDLTRDAEFNNVLPSGIPGLDSQGNKVCLQAAPSAILNNASQFDGTATSCYFNPTTGLQCGLLVGRGAPPLPHSGTCFDRMNDALPTTRVQSNVATSLYNALNANLTKRVTHGLQLTASYTWSRLMDNQQGEGSPDGQEIVMEPLHPGSMWAPSLFDVRNVFHLSGIYHFPDFISSKGFAGKLANGWMTNGILSLQSGYPFTATLSTDRENISWLPGIGNVPDVPDLVPGRSSYSVTHGKSTGCTGIAAGTPLGTPKQWYDPCAFTLQPAGFIGTEPRNFLRGPGLANLDFSIVKDTAVSMLGEGGKIEFRAEFFDLLNHAIFSQPSTIVAGGGLCAINATTNPTGVAACPITPINGAGSISSTVTNAGALPGGQRQIQFGLKVIF